jgi:hypothetical protein
MLVKSNVAFFIISFVLFLGAISLNIAAISGHEIFPYNLHYQSFIILVCFFSTIPVANLIRNKFNLSTERTLTARPYYDFFGLFRSALISKPLWLSIILAGSTAYFVYNLAVYIYNQPSENEYIKGIYLLTDHSHFVRLLTAVEFHFYRIAELKFFTSLAMMFFVVDSFILMPVNNKEV